jgi:hypothetical protein
MPHRLAAVAVDFSRYLIVIVPQSRPTAVPDELNITSKRFQGLST